MLGVCYLLFFIYTLFIICQFSFIIYDLLSHYWLYIYLLSLIVLFVFPTILWVPLFPPKSFLWIWLTGPSLGKLFGALRWWAIASLENRRRFRSWQRPYPSYARTLCGCPAVDVGGQIRSGCFFLNRLLYSTLGSWVGTKVRFIFFSHFLGCA